MNPDLLSLFVAVEAAVDAHAMLARSTKINPKGAEAELRVTREGCTVAILVKVRGSNKRPTEISGFGATPEEAAQKLIDGLDTWASVL